MERYPSNIFYLLPLPTELLLANQLSHLTCFHMTKATTDTGSLIEALRRCQTTLTRAELHYVALTSDGDLMPACRAMLAMPKLEFLELQLLGSDIRPGQNTDVPHGGVCPESHKREGIEPIKEWLQAILDRRTNRRGTS